VPTVVLKRVTQKATLKETYNPFKFLASLKMPIFSGPSPKNQSKVNPYHGRDGNKESLKARIQITKSGANRTKKYRIINVV
jgi:hypothetical protein